MFGCSIPLLFSKYLLQFAFICGCIIAFKEALDADDCALVFACVCVSVGNYDTVTWHHIIIKHNTSGITYSSYLCACVCMYMLLSCAFFSTHNYNYNCMMLEADRWCILSYCNWTKKNGNAKLGRRTLNSNSSGPSLSVCLSNDGRKFNYILTITLIITIIA